MPESVPSARVPELDVTDLGRLFALSLDLLAIASPIDGYFRRVNPAVSRVLGWSESELLATPIATLVHPDDLDASIRALARLARGESLIQFEHRLRCKDGTYRWIGWNTAASAADGLVYCAGRDMTERRAADAALRASERQYRSLLDVSDAGFCILEVEVDRDEHIDCRFVEVSTGFERLTGLQDVVGRCMRDLLPAHEEFWFESMAAVATTGGPMRFEQRARELGDRWFEVHAFRLDPPECRRIGALFTDVTERHRVEEALSAELEAMTRLHALSRRVTSATSLESLLAAVIDAAIVLHGAQFGSVQIYDSSTRTLRIVAQRGLNAAYLERFGTVEVDVGSCSGMAIARGERVVIDDVQRELRFARSLEGARLAGYRALQCTPLHGPTGELLGVLSTHFSAPRKLSGRDHRLTDLYAALASDAIARHMLERSLRNSEERLRLAVEVGQLATWDWHIDSGEVSWSDDHYLLLGYPVGGIEPSYEAWAQRVHPDDLPGAEAALVRARDTRSDYARTLRLLHPDRTVRWASARGRFFYDGTGRPVRMIGVMIDITSRREAEERQRLLITELQHRTRNLIGVVQSLAHQTLGESGSLGSFRAQFDDRLAALSRVQGLLARADRRRVMLRDVLQMELEALGSPGDKAIELEGPEVALPAEMVQTLALALHELATNARKYGALRTDGGDLTVRWRVFDAVGRGRFLELDWHEAGLRARDLAGADASGGGFGRELIERALPYQLNAETRYEITADAVHCWIRVPLNVTPRGTGHGTS